MAISFDISDLRADGAMLEENNTTSDMGHHTAIGAIDKVRTTLMLDITDLRDDEEMDVHLVEDRLDTSFSDLDFGINEPLAVVREQSCDSRTSFAEDLLHKRQFQQQETSLPCLQQETSVGSGGGWSFLVSGTESGPESSSFEMGDAHVRSNQCKRVRPRSPRSPHPRGRDSLHQTEATRSRSGSMRRGRQSRSPLPGKDGEKREGHKSRSPSKDASDTERVDSLNSDKKESRHRFFDKVGIMFKDQQAPPLKLSASTRTASDMSAATTRTPSVNDHTSFASSFATSGFPSMIMQDDTAAALRWFDEGKITTAPTMSSMSASLSRKGSMKQCATCQSSYTGFGIVCSTCRKSPRGSFMQCHGCSTFFKGFGSTCHECVGLA